jgi:hypothetical protein
VQTFLPLPDLAASAACLDRQRLGKQRVETLQIIRAHTLGTGWVNHPATKMWNGHLPGLLAYQRAVCAEWKGRGYRDTCLGKSEEALEDYHTETYFLPAWFGDPEFHRSHQSNLVRKNPEHYGPQFLGVPDDLPYVWP